MNTRFSWMVKGKKLYWNWNSFGKIKKELYICIIKFNYKKNVMRVKLSYYGSGSTTLVNMDRFTTMYQTTDNRSGKLFTKIHFSETNFIMVEESPQEIEDIMELIESGEKQEVEWKVPTIDERFERQSYQPRPQRNYQQQPRERSYNNHGTPNYNRW